MFLLPLWNCYFGNIKDSEIKASKSGKPLKKIYDVMFTSL